ncbi:MAG: transcriptional repressor [Candidatus Aminicenantes bacterium]|nr:transcriptional repressor [Candidatus Aminicenantes bacterium]
MRETRAKTTRRTPQRLAITAFLEGNDGHPTAEDIHEALKPLFPTMSLSTVYNTLHSLQREGRVHELAVEPGRCRFDPEPGPHHHLVCTRCRKVVDVDRDFPVRLTPREARGFRGLHAHIVFYGTCPDCRDKAP